MTYEINLEQSVPFVTAVGIFEKAAEKSGLEAKTTFPERTFDCKRLPKPIANAFREIHEKCSTAVITLKKNIFSTAYINMTGIIIKPGTGYSVKIVRVSPSNIFKKKYLTEYENKVRSLIREHTCNN